MDRYWSTGRGLGTAAINDPGMTSALPAAIFMRRSFRDVIHHRLFCLVSSITQRKVELEA